MSNHWFEKYEQARADNTAHFRKIMELQKENEKLTKALKIAESALSSICSHDGHKVLGISKNKAVEGFSNNLHVCRKALTQIKKIKRGE